MERRHDESQKNYRERLKDTALNLKNYLKGKIIPGTESYGGRKKGRWHPSKGAEQSADVYRKKKAHRNKRRKIAYLSKRRNKCLR